MYELQRFEGVEMAKLIKHIFGTYEADDVRWARGVGPLVMPRR